MPDLIEEEEVSVIDPALASEATDIADTRVLLYACGFVLHCLYDRYGEKIQPIEIKDRTKAAARIIINQIGHDGCMAMEGFEVQDLLCRLSGLFTELTTSMKNQNATNAGTLCSIFATKLGIYCGRGGGGDKRGYKAQTQYSQTQNPNRQDTVQIRPPMPGRMGG